MIIKQLSVFLENKSGRLAEITEILAKENINISALSIADTSEFGILRLIVSNPSRAYKLLQENHITVSLTEVLSMSIPNAPGSLARVLRILSDEKVSLEYIYAFTVGEQAIEVMKPDDLNRCIEVLQAHKVELIEASKVYNF